MESMRYAVLSLLLVAAGPLTAAEWTDHNSHDPGRTALAEPAPAAGLNRVIALAATRPDSREFAEAWSGWLEAHPAEDVDRTIDAVASRAISLSSMSAMARDPTTPARRPSRERLVAHMQHLARKAGVQSQSR